VPQPTRVRSRTTARSLVGVLAAIAALGVAAPTADAHTDVEYTVPAADERVPEPVTTITIAFGDPVTVVGEGFEVFTPDEETIRPGFFTDDDTVYVLTLPEPLSGGVVGVRYEVTASDGHVLSDAFTFTVADATSEPTAASVTTPEPTPEPSAPQPSAPQPTAPQPTVDGGSGRDDDEGGSSTGIVVGVGVAVVVAAGAAVVLRSRLGARPT
jgi:methionine-rich copper-binding protein CopC